MRGADRQVIALETDEAFGARPRKVMVHYPGLGELFEMTILPEYTKGRRRPSAGPARTPRRRVGKRLGHDRGSRGAVTKCSDARRAIPGRSRRQALTHPTGTPPPCADSWGGALQGQGERSDSTPIMTHQQLIDDHARVPIGRTRASRGGGSIGLVLLIALVLVGAAGGLLFIGRDKAEPFILALLAALAVAGVFLLFALAAGILRISGREAASPLLKAVVDHSNEGTLVTDAGGRVLYANAAYRSLVEASGPEDVRPVERVFIGDPGVSEAVYRLLKAAREGRRGQEEVRVGAHKGEAGRWLRIRVRPLGEGKRESRMTVWSLADVTRELERHENVFQELQHAIDYLDHAPAGFFSAEGNGNIVYLNATLANWLDHDLAQVGSGGLKLEDIVAGEGTALLTTLAAVPGDVKTEILDIDLKTRGGRTVPARLFHKVAFGADGAPGASRTLVLNRARDGGSDPQRAAEVRFMRFFQNTPMAIATVDKHGRIADSNARFARLFNPVFKGEARQGTPQADRSILAVVAERDRGTLEAAIRRAAEGQGEIAPVDAALAGAGERYASFFVTAIEEEEDRDQEAAIVYALETTQQRTLENQVNQQQKMETIGRLAGNIAHDFNNLLGAIMMATDFLLERAPADRSVVPGHHAGQAERQPGGEPGAAAAGLFAQADHAPAGDRSRRGAVGSHRAAAPAHRRERDAQRPASARPLAGQGRCRAV